MKTILLFLLFITDILCQSGSGSISGKVIDKNTQEPIIGAVLFLEKTSLGTYSDSSGFYKIYKVPFGKYNLTSHCFGYPNSKLIPFEISPNEPDIKINIEIAPNDINNEGIFDTIYFEGFKGYIREMRYTPKHSWNASPKSRFTPNADEILLVEKCIISQYVNAQYRFALCRYKEYRKLYSDEDFKELKSPKEEFTDEVIQNLLDEIKAEYPQYDREYFGYIAKTGARKILISFLPQRIKTFTIADESHLKNLPMMIFDLTTKKLNIAGCEDD